VNRAAEVTLARSAAFADAQTKSFNVQLMLKPVQHVVADCAGVAHVDQRGPFSVQSLMAQPAERLNRFSGARWVDRAVVRESLALPGIVRPEPGYMLGR
jgi:hypothetical protein